MSNVLAPAQIGGKEWIWRGTCRREGDCYLGLRGFRMVGVRVQKVGHLRVKLDQANNLVGVAILFDVNLFRFWMPGCDAGVTAVAKIVVKQH